MKLLIIGGTRFLGRYLVTAALANNHEVTLFNRGRHSSQPAVETIQGDRNSDLGKLKGRRWDAVIDTCGMLPSAVKAAAEILSDSTDTYTFISTQNVYGDVSTPGVDESSPLKSLTPEQLEQANAIDTTGEPSYGPLYGGLKAHCEQAVEEIMPNRVLSIRPGLIVGPHDYTDRFTYWVVRVARGGEVLAPGRPDRMVQLIDVRDLAEWTVKMIERKQTGVYNANGLANTFTMQDVLEECKAVSGSDATFTWVGESFLLEENVAAWSDMPLWLPEEAAPHLKGFMFVSYEKAVGEGLRFRLLRETIAGTLQWAQGYSGDLKAGISAEREQMLLSKWHADARSTHSV
jgi:2'-hydroxyisoflavone reductase